MMREFRFTIDEECAGERLDKALPALLEGLASRSFLQKLIKDGNVKVNDAAVKGSRALREGESISILLPDAEAPEIAAEELPLDVLYEDSDVIVVNKPKGMVVHPSAGHTSGTLVNALLWYTQHHAGSSLSGVNGVLRPGIVHRIDMDTTGSVLVCKNDAAHQVLAEQFAEHSITRAYHAIVLGNLGDDEGTVDAPIGRHPKERKKMAVVPAGSGRRAVTHYRVLERFDGYTYLECRLETGRTHQIRVHLAHIGHPVLGDSTYSNARWAFRLDGQTLHAKTLGFVSPSTGEYIGVDAPLPGYFTRLLEILRG